MTDEEQVAERARWRAEIQRRIAELDLVAEFERQGHTTYASADVNGVLEIRGITLKDFRIHLAQDHWSDEEAEAAWRRGWRPGE